MRVLALVALVVLTPNLLWVSRSSVALRNDGADPLTIRLVLADDPAQVVEAGALAPGQGRFMWIVPRGDATLMVEVQDGGLWNRHCATYVEEGMYRVEFKLRSPSEVACKVSFPILERLLIRDVLR
jgi:hypothetical protein